MADAAKPLAAAPASSSKQTASQAYRFGLLTNLTNPKSLAFFSSVFSTLFSPNIALWLKLAGIATVAMISLAWHITVATTFSLPRARQTYARAKGVLDRCAGGLMSVFGAKLILGR
jgi:threonine efflux protein